jgi:hypothetical protein
LSFIPRRDQAAGIFEDLRLCRALCGRFFLGGRTVINSKSLEFASLSSRRQTVS